MTHDNYFEYIIYIYIAVIVVIYIFVGLFSSFIYKRLIPYLKGKKVGQVVREEGMKTHLKKAGTPTMGGAVFGIIFIVFGALYTLYEIILGHFYFDVKYVPIFCMFALGLMYIGYKDDIKKIKLKNTDGLTPKTKLIYQIGCSLIFVVIIYLLKSSQGLNTYIKIPIVNLFMYDIKLDYANIIMMAIVVVVNVFILVGTQNGVNFTDGVDALLASVTIVICIFFALISLLKLLIALYVVNIVMISLLFSFKKYNKYPAQIFMGDTGSLFLGAYVGGMSLLLDIQYFLPIFGCVYMMEVISVILQVTYFKATHGKRIFKMAPIHHHFEKCGWSEKKVVTVFTVLTVSTCMLTLVLLMF